MEFSRIIIDADSLLYRCGFAAEKEEVSHALHNLKSQLGKIKEDLSCDVTDIYIKGVGNFRDEVAQSRVYKGTRSTRIPTHYPALREYIINYHGAKEVDGMEADDAVSIELWKNRDKDSGVILAAMDKDLWNTPGWHYNYHPSKRYVEYITVQEANSNFIHQLITGDKTDNVGGLPRFSREFLELFSLPSRNGAGSSGAKKLLRGLSNTEALERVWEAYLSFGREEGWDDNETRRYFLEQGRLLWMTRGLNQDGSPVLWEVPKDSAYWKY